MQAPAAEGAAGVTPQSITTKDRSMSSLTADAALALKQQTGLVSPPASVH